MASSISVSRTKQGPRLAEPSPLEAQASQLLRHCPDLCDLRALPLSPPGLLPHPAPSHFAPRVITDSVCWGAHAA